MSVTAAARSHAGSNGSGAPLPAHVDVAIVGAGFGGLGAAIQLKRAGFDDLVVLERAADVGGTWWANTYPGCQCDVASHLYSFSFAPNPHWTHSYPEQPQILEYLRDTARRFGLTPHLRLRCEMRDAAYHADEGRWHVETSQGRLTARVLVAAPGLLSEPYTPALPGLELFRGTAFHSASWDHGHDLAGERVLVIGTGASAVQIVPRIQPEVKRLYVLQRTPPWVFPHPDRAIGPLKKRLYRRFPVLQRLSRLFIYSWREALVPAFVSHLGLLRLGEALARRHLRRQVADPELRHRLTPRYAVGCKRLTLSDDWYPALTASNAEVVSEGIAEVREHSVVTEDGVERELDTIVFATGFSPSDPPIAHRLRGPDGRTLADVWQGSPQAYLSVSVSGFPNLFLLYGPNSNLGHNSIVYMMESQVRYLIEAMRTMRERGVRSVDVRGEVQDRWNDDLQQRLRRTVWDVGGCSSWYLDRNGRNSVQWPDFTFRFRRRLARFDPADYRLEPVRSAASAATAS